VTVNNKLPVPTYYTCKHRTLITRIDFLTSHIFIRPLVSVKLGNLLPIPNAVFCSTNHSDLLFVIFFQETRGAEPEEWESSPQVSGQELCLHYHVSSCKFLVWFRSKDWQTIPIFTYSQVPDDMKWACTFCGFFASMQFRRFLHIVSKIFLC
jgi:hypothetical protein